MALQHHISIAELSRLGQKEILRFIRQQFPRYTPTEVNREEPEVYAFLGERNIRAAIRQKILREDYTTGWSDRALIAYVVAQYTGAPIKLIRHDNPLLADELRLRNIVGSLIEKGILTGKRPPHFFENMARERRKVYVAKNFKGYSLTQLREADQALYHALSKKERDMLVNEKILVRKKVEKGKQRPYERKVFGVRQTMAQTIRAAEDASTYATASSLPPSYEPYRVAEEYIWYAMRALRSGSQTPSNKEADIDSFVHLPLDERLRWAQEQGMFGEV